MNASETTTRYPWCALALSFLAAGLGHIYCGRIRKGLILYCAWLMLPVTAMVAALMTPATTVLVTLILAPTLAIIGLYLYAAVDAWIAARRIGDRYIARDYNCRLVYSLLATVGILYPILLLTVIRSFVFEAFYVPSGSMSPSVLDGDRVLVNKLAYRGELPQRGEVVAFLAPGATGQVYLKRVIALPGDTVEIRDDELLINHRRLSRDRVPTASLSAHCRTHLRQRLCGIERGPTVSSHVGQRPIGRQRHGGAVRPSNRTGRQYFPVGRQPRRLRRIAVSSDVFILAT